MAAPTLLGVSSCLLLIPYAAQAERLYCLEDQTTNAVTLNLSQRKETNDNICPFVIDNKWSQDPRHCNWEIKTVDFRDPSYLVIESFPADHLAGNLTYSVAKAHEIDFMRLFAVSIRGHCSGWNGWSGARQFQLLPLYSASESAGIVLGESNLGNTSLFSQFYLRLGHSNRETCSRGFVMHNASCLTVRRTDRMAEAAAFSSLTDLESALAAYEKSASHGDMGNEKHNTTEPMRVAMFHCSSNNNSSSSSSSTEAAHLAYWIPSNGPCNSSRCGHWSIPASRLGLGTGDCLSVQREPGIGSALFRPVNCTVAMATIVSFPAAPSVGEEDRCGGNTAAAAEQCTVAQLRHICCATAEAAHTSADQLPVKYFILTAAIIITFIALLAA